MSLRSLLSIALPMVALAACGRFGFESTERGTTDGALPTSDAALSVDASPDTGGGSFMCGVDMVLDSELVAIPTLKLGAQCWLARNMNVGTRINGAVAMTSNGTLEKYCYNNLPARCTTLGGLYQWNEAMQYVIGERARGICPAGWHIPSDVDWKTLEMFLGMDAATVDLFGYRGTAGAALGIGGSAKFEAPYAGIRTDTAVWFGLDTDTFFWSTTEGLAGANGVARRLGTSDPGIDRTGYAKANGFSVRCVMD